jgi:hypothetical protein
MIPKKPIPCIRMLLLCVPAPPIEIKNKKPNPKNIFFIKSMAHPHIVKPVILEHIKNNIATPIHIIWVKV